MHTAQQAYNTKNAHMQDTIAVDDDIDVAIVKLMSNGKGYTLDEVMTNLSSRGIQDIEAIKPTMFAMKTEGWFDQRNIAGMSPVYVLRPGHTVSMLGDPKRPTRVRKFKLADEPVIDPAGKIKMSEGLDVAFWKLMQDGKSRTAKDIMALICEFGFDRTQANRRLATLINTSRWFDRDTRGNATVYKLKARFPCPTPEEDRGPKLAVFVEPEAVPEDDDRTRLRWKEPEEVVVAASAPVTTDQPKYLSPQDRRDLAVEDLMKLLEIKRTDSVRDAVWKVMSDFGEYTVTDLTLLLSDYGFNRGRISPILTQLYNKGFLHRRSQPGSRRSMFCYKLKEGVGSFAKDKEIADLPEIVAKQPQQELPIETQPEEKEPQIMAPATAPESILKVVATGTASAVELLSISVKIRGVEIDVPEFAQLYRELRASGFHAGANTPMTTLIESKFMIKGLEFTRSELIDLVEKMQKLGATFQKAVQ